MLQLLLLGGASLIAAARVAGPRLTAHERVDLVLLSRIGRCTVIEGLGRETLLVVLPLTLRNYFLELMVLTYLSVSVEELLIHRTSRDLHAEVE